MGGEGEGAGCLPRTRLSLGVDICGRFLELRGVANLQLRRPISAARILSLLQRSINVFMFTATQLDTFTISHLC